MKAISHKEINSKGRELMKIQKISQKLDKHSIIVKIKTTEAEGVYREEVARQTNIPLIPPYSIEVFNNTPDIVTKFKMMGFTGLKGILVSIEDDAGELLFKLKPIITRNNTYQIINIYAHEIGYILDRTFPMQLLLFPEQHYKE
uniref:Uncharacterized protein n=1 Tax=viral metagenome TaxID=1070528 RepID=A0A6H1ZSB0_9ZZZZ